MMKRILILLLALCLSVCLFACREEKPGQYYTLISYGMDTNTMSESALRYYSGGEDLYLKMYDDGTAEMKVSPGDPIQMEYADGLIWRPETPDITATYTVDGDTVTIVDGAATMVFEKD